MPPDVFDEVFCERPVRLGNHHHAIGGSVNPTRLENRSTLTPGSNGLVVSKGFAQVHGGIRVLSHRLRAETTSYD